MVLSTGFLKIFQDFLDFFKTSFGISLKECDFGNLGQSFFSGGFLFHTSNLSENLDLSISFFCGKAGARTQNQRLKRALLYH